VGKYKHDWRELTHNEKVKYAMAMRRFNLGIWGYPTSVFRKVVLTTREGNDNTTKVFTRDLRKLIGGIRGDGYELEYNGGFELTPDKGLLHWHGLLRVKGGFLKLYDGPVLSGVVDYIDKDGRPSSPHSRANRRELGDRWNKIHGAFVVLMESIDTGEQLKEYILKDIMKEYLSVEYIGEDFTRNKFVFSRGWMREGWKEVEALAKTWVLGGLDTGWMDSEKWKLVNEIMKAWAEKSEAMFLGKKIGGKRTGYFYLELGRVAEAVGGAFAPCDYEYYEY
jgi:hypothetical protein